LQLLEKTLRLRLPRPGNRHGNPRKNQPKTAMVTMGVQAVIIDPGGRILLVRHGYRPGWHFPGGGVERNEMVATSLARELKEEAGIELTSEAQIFGLYSHFEQFPGDHIVLYVSRHWRQPQIPRPNKEIAEQGFFALHSLPKDTSSASLRRINEIFHGATQTDTW